MEGDCGASVVGKGVSVYYIGTGQPLKVVGVFPNFFFIVVKHKHKIYHLNHLNVQFSGLTYVRGQSFMGSRHHHSFP